MAREEVLPFLLGQAPTGQGTGPAGPGGWVDCPEQHRAALDRGDQRAPGRVERRISWPSAGLGQSSTSLGLG